MRRRLLWHGVLLLLAGLLIGIVVPLVRNPRMGLSAHVGTVMSGMLLLLVGAVWEEVRLGARAAETTFRLALGGNYANAAGLFLAAVLGTSRSTPLAGAGFAGGAAAEALVGAALTGGAVATLALCVLLLRGLGGRT